MASKSELEIKALKLCSNYLGGPWKDEDKFKVEVLNGGLTNKLYICSTQTENNEVLKVILRIYGLIMQDVDAQITESVVFAVLGSKGLGPKLHGAFPDGRLEEYIPGRNLVTKDLQNPEISKMIATRLAEYHQLHMPMTKDPRLLEQFIGYYTKAKTLGVNVSQYNNEFQHCCDLIKTSKSPILFCHNDVHEGNILIDARSKGEGKTDGESLRLIDFEYSAYGYRAFDFANHFNEWMFDYSNPKWPYYHYKPHDFPTEAQQSNFIDAYLERTGFNTTENREEILREIVDFALVGHVYWALWSEIQGKVSDIQFDYVGYAGARMDSYHRLMSIHRLGQVQLNENHNHREETVIH